MAGSAIYIMPSILKAVKLSQTIDIKGIFSLSESCQVKNYS